MHHNHKFKPATDENIKKHIHDHYEETFKTQKEFYQNISTDLFNGAPSDEKLKDDILNHLFNKDYMSHHDTLIPGEEYDYYDIVKEIQDSQNEKLLIILLDKKKNILEYKIVKEGTVDSLRNGRQFWDEFQYLLSNKETYYFIIVHNHPLAVYAFPSYGDNSSCSYIAMLGLCFHIKLLDSCIITQYDFYSQYEAEKNLPKDKMLLHPTISKESSDILFKKDRFMFRFIYTAFENRLY